MEWVVGGDWNLTSLDSLHGIFNLEDVPIGTELGLDETTNSWSWYRRGHT